MAGGVLHYAHDIKAAAERWGIPASVLAGLIEVESGGNEHVVSPAGAFGLTQFIPGTARSYNVRRGDPKSQIDGGAHYLHDLGYAKDPHRALKSYNAGPGNPDAAGDYDKKVLAAAKKYEGAGFSGAAGAAGAGASGTAAAGTSGGGESLFDKLRRVAFELLLYAVLVAGGVAVIALGTMRLAGAAGARA